MKNALFLDRDGVLNHLVCNRPPWLLSEIKIFKEAYEIVKLAKIRDYVPIVISNQPDAGRGSITYSKLDLINKKIMEKLSIDHYYICKHAYNGMCDCRKPLAGSFYKAEKINNINLNESFMVGDRDKDIIAGNKAGCKTVYISKSQSKEADFNVVDHLTLLELLRKLLV